MHAWWCLLLRLSVWKPPMAFCTFSVSAPGTERATFNKLRLLKKKPQLFQINFAVFPCYPLKYYLEIRYFVANWILLSVCWGCFLNAKQFSHAWAAAAVCVCSDSHLYCPFSVTLSEAVRTFEKLIHRTACTAFCRNSHMWWLSSLSLKRSTLFSTW